MALIPQSVIDKLGRMQKLQGASVSDPQSDVNTQPQQVATQQVNPIVNPVTQPVQEKPKIDPASRYAGLFSDWKDKQAPEYNTRYEKQQKALMTAQTIGNALALVGDVAGVAAGAPVKRRQFKPTEPYLQAIENKRMQYMKDTEAFDREKSLNLRVLAGLITQEEANAEAAAYRNETLGLAKNRDLRDAETLKLNQEKDRRASVAQGEATKLGQDKLKEDQRQFNLTQSAKKEEITAKNAAEMVKNVQKDEKGNLGLFTDTGKKVASLDESMVNKAFAMIQEDYGDSPALQDDITLLKAQFGEGLSKDARAFLVTKHWNNSPKAKKFLQLDKSETADFPAPNTGAATNPTWFQRATI